MGVRVELGSGAVGSCRVAGAAGVPADEAAVKAAAGGAGAESGGDGEGRCGLIVVVVVIVR